MEFKVTLKRKLTLPTCGESTLPTCSESDLSIKINVKKSKNMSGNDYYLCGKMAENYGDLIYAFKCYLKASTEYTHAMAEWKVGQFYLNSYGLEKAVEKDEKKAIEYFRRSAE